MKFNIRKNALKLLNHVYQHCDSNLQVRNLNCKSLIDSETTESDLILANRYLWQKGYINNKPMIKENYECEITVLGIDWVEDCHEKNTVQ